MKKGGHSKEPSQKDQEQGLVMAASRGARLIKAPYGMIWVKVAASARNRDEVCPKPPKSHPKMDVFPTADNGG